MIDVMTAFTLVEHAGAATAVPPQGPPGYAPDPQPRAPAAAHRGRLDQRAGLHPARTTRTCSREAGRPDLAEDERIRSRPVPDRQRRQPLPRGGRGPDRRGPRPSGSTSAPTVGIPASAVPDPRGARRRPSRGRPPAGRSLQGDPPAGAVLGHPRPDRPPPCRAERRSTTTRCWPRWPAGRAGARPGEAERRPAEDTDDRHRRDATFGDVTVRPRRRTTWPRSRCTARRPTTSTPRSWSAWSRPWPGPRPRGRRAVVLCSEGRHFCAGLDFGIDRTGPNPTLWPPSTARPAG